MNSLIGVLLNTRRTFQELEREPVDKLNFKSSLLYCLSGLAAWIQVVVPRRQDLGEHVFWTAVLWLLFSCVLNLVVGRYIISKVLFKVGKALNGHADLLDVIVVNAYAGVPWFFIAVPAAFYKGFILGNDIAAYERNSLSVLDLVALALCLKILFQGLKYFNAYGTWKAIVTISPLILFPIVVVAVLSFLLSLQ